MDATAYTAMKREVAAVRLPRDVISVRGPDAQSYLQGQISQDVEQLAVGASAWSLILQPQGKVDAWFRITKVGDDDFVLDIDAGAGAALVARIERFKLRVDFAIEWLGWGCIAVRGPETPGDLEGAVRAPVRWGPMSGVDLLGPDVAIPAGMIEADLDVYEALRIEAGVPVNGRELTEDTIPAEAGIVEQSVSFTKGCYTGQELVARVDSRGNNTPRNLRGLIFTEAVLAPDDAEVFRADNRDKAVGWVTSIAESLDLRAPVALAYVGRAVDVGAEVVVAWDGGETTAVVNSLPLG